MDARKVLVDTIVKKVLRPDYDAGRLPATELGVQDLKDFYRDRAVDEIIDDDVWEEAVQRVITWREADWNREAPILTKILSRFPKFPTVDKVSEILGEDRSIEYKTALEAAEGIPSFPDERHCSPWRRADMEAAVSAVTDIIAPHIDDQESMRIAFDKLVDSMRARRRERASENASRKAAARALGIWFPMSKDMTKWHTDPRTAATMPELVYFMDAVVKRMRMARSYLQYMPRRRMSTKACADLPLNIARMRAYVRGFDRVIRRK